MQLKTDRPIRAILKEECQRVFFGEGNISSYALDHYVMDNCAEDKHVLTFLEATNLVGPIIISPSPEDRHKRTLSYHPMGRKGKLYGLSGRLLKEKKLYNVTVNASPFSGNTGLLDNYFIELANHEIVGHAIMDLNDHNGMDPRSCLMAVKRSDEEYIRASQERLGLYLCDMCNERLPKGIPKSRLH